MLSGNLPEDHPYSPNCIYKCTDTTAVNVGDPTAEFIHRDGTKLQRCKAENTTAARKLLETEVEFKQQMLKAAADLASTFSQEVSATLELIDKWSEWIANGRVDHMFFRTDKTFLTDSTVITTQLTFSLHMGRLMKEYINNLQGTKTLAAYIKEQQTVIESMVNAGLPRAEYEKLFGFIFILNLNNDFNESIRRYELDKKLLPDTMTFGAAQKFARDWQSDKTSLDAVLTNNGNPTSSTNQITINATKVGKGGKPNSRNPGGKPNKDQKPPKASKPNCRHCGYNKGHDTAGCDKCTGELKQHLIRVDAEQQKELKALRAKQAEDKKNKTNNSSEQP